MKNENYGPGDPTQKRHSSRMLWVLGLGALAVLFFFIFGIPYSGIQPGKEKPYTTAAESTDYEVLESGVSAPLMSELEQFSVPDANIQREIGALLDRYEELTNTLIATTPEAAQAAATEMKEIIREFDPSLAEVEQRTAFIGHAQNLMANLNEVINAEVDPDRDFTNVYERNEALVEAMRPYLPSITTSLLSLVKQFGHTNDETIYVYYCPRSYEGEKYWLNDEEMIRNPYVGKYHPDFQCGVLDQKI